MPVRQSRPYEPNPLLRQQRQFGSFGLPTAELHVPPLDQGLDPGGTRRVRVRVRYGTLTVLLSGLLRSPEIATKKCPGRGMCVPYSRTIRIFLHSRAITSQEIILVRFMI